MAYWEDERFILNHAPESTWLQFRDGVAARFYRLLMNFVHPKDVQRPNKVSICAIFKDEAPYLREWIEFHRIVGVEHFYLYNNQSDDDFRSILAPYVEKGIVTLIEWPYPQAQMEAYWDCVARFRMETRWIGFIDLDEFVVPRKANNIYEILQPFEKNRPVVMFYWRVFGSSGRLDRSRNGLVTEDFVCCWPKHDDLGKVFYNTAYDPMPEFHKNVSMHHTQWAKYSGIAFPPVNMDGNVCVGTRHMVDSLDFPVQINHYFTKSYREYCVTKQKRGDVMYSKNPHDEQYFFLHDEKCTAVDYSAYRFLIRLKKAMQEHERGAVR